MTGVSLRMGAHLSPKIDIKQICAFCSRVGGVPAVRPRMLAPAANVRLRAFDRSVAHHSLARRALSSRGPVGLFRLHLPGQLVVLLDVLGLPGVADPLVADGARGQVAAAVDHVGGEGALLLLVLVL